MIVRNFLYVQVGDEVQLTCIKCIRNYKIRFYEIKKGNYNHTIVVGGVKKNTSGVCEN